MAYQFIHVEAYARERKEIKEDKTSSKKKTNKKDYSNGSKGRTMREIIAEAVREPGNCPHIEPEKIANPALAPEKIYGLDLEYVEKEANEWAENAKDGGNQALRKNGHCLLSGVVSLPEGTPDKDWQRFKQDALEWLKKEYGSNLRSVIEHKDENNPHIHFYCIPDAGKQFFSIHKGIEARTKARQEKLSGKEQNLAYCEAMRNWQDKFSKEVAQKHGLARIGPGRRRLSRAAWNKEQQQAKALEEAIKRGAKTMKKAEKKAAEIVEQAQEKARKTEGFGASVGGFFAGVAGEWHKPTKATKEAAEAAAEALEKEREKHKKEVEELNKTSRYELAQSESARDHLKQTNKELRTELKNIYSKHGDYIKEQEDREKAEREAKEAEQRRQQREQEQEEQRADERKRHRGSDTKRCST